MSQALNGTGGSSSTAQPPPKPREPANKEASVTFTSTGSITMHGSLGRMTRHSATFEIYSPNTVLNTSEALTDFSIHFHGQVIYFGRAVIRSIVDAGAKVICEVTLDEAQWSKVDAQLIARRDGRIAGEFKEFLREWQKFYLVSPEFKVVVADMQTFFHNLQLWLNQIEIKIRRTASHQSEGLNHQVIADLKNPIVQSIDTLIDCFESIVSKLPDDSHPAYQAYLRRHLHPLVLSSPFANRAFYKPLGYAGDYQMVDMMIRPPEEGSDLFSKMINIWLLGQTPAQAHRNRVAYLERKLIEETIRAKSQKRRLKVFNLGCGPAAEIQGFARMQNICQSADFSLVDFNVETLNFLEKKLNSINTVSRPISFRTLRKSVTQILKDNGRTLSPHSGGKYQYIYCAGLFDYLSDAVCKQLMGIFYEMLEPGGLLLATNASDMMNASRPFRYSMEYILDWHLIYRNHHQFLNVLPENINKDEVSVTADETGANLFLEVRKSLNV